MEKHRAIPEGYMKVGELAKSAGITVRTLQYYDKEGLLSPHAMSEGGFRLYNDKDIVKLAQILLMKQLGFPLSEIKKRLTSLNTPSDVIKALTEQAAEIRKKIKLLSESLGEIDALKEEIAQMESVDFKKFAAILMNLQMKNKHYWMIKHFDDDVMEKLSEGMSREKAKAIIETTNRLFDEAVKFQKEGVAPESEKGQTFAKAFWDTVMEATDGDMELIEKLSKMAEINSSDEDWTAKQFMQSAIQIYLNNLYGDSEGDAQNG